MSTTGKRKMSKRRRFFRAPKFFAETYAEYAGRLWNETNPEARKEIANDRVSAAIRQMQSIKYKDISLESLQRLDSACESMHYAIVNITEAQGEELHELAREVFVGSAAPVLVAVEPEQHGGVLREAAQELAEVP